VHTEKTFEPYYDIFVTLLKPEPKLIGIQAAVTDGERSLIKALRVAFSEDLILLRWFIHRKDNLRHRAEIPKEMQQEEVSTTMILKFWPKASPSEGEEGWHRNLISDSQFPWMAAQEWSRKHEVFNDFLCSWSCCMCLDVLLHGAPQTQMRVWKAKANYSCLSWFQLNDTRY